MNSRSLASNVEDEWMFLSHPWGPSCPAYNDGRRIEIKKSACIDHGDSCNSLEFVASNHIGTHIDFPRHFDPVGKTVTDYHAVDFIYDFPFIVDLFAKQPGELIGVADLQDAATSTNHERIDLLLLRTGLERVRATRTYWENSIGVAPEVADFLRSHFPSVRAIGLDTISLTSLAHRSTGREAHKRFLCHPQPILIMEDLKLSECGRSSTQLKQVIALPLRIEDGDGGPCTIIARKN